MQNFLDLAPQMGEHLVQRTDLLSWILGRLKPKRFDPNKQYASEILAVLLQQRWGARGEWMRAACVVQSRGILWT